MTYRDRPDAYDYYADHFEGCFNGWGDEISRVKVAAELNPRTGEMAEAEEIVTLTTPHGDFVVSIFLPSFDISVGWAGAAT